MVEILGIDDIKPSLILEPVIAFKRPIEFFESQLDVQAVEDYDDLDYYKMLVLRSSSGFTFVLIDYRRAPVKGTMVRLPIAVENDDTAIETILSDLKLERSDVMWRANDWPARRQWIFRYLRDHGKTEPTL